MGRVEDFSDNLKDVFHYPKENENRYERRTTAAMDCSGNSWGGISFEDNGNRVFFLQGMDPHGECIYKQVIRDCAMPSAPMLFCRDDGGLSAVWIEWNENHWSVIYASKDKDEPDFLLTTVHCSANACLQPVMCFHDGSPWVAWSGYDESVDKFVVFSSHSMNSKWHAPVAHFSGEGHGFRPAICSDGESIFLAWDEGSDGSQSITVREIHTGGGSWHDYRIKRTGERLMRPSLCINGSSGCLVACVSIMDVTDSRLCISDHSTGIVFARIADGNLSVNAEAVADLNEGLLGKRVYVPYFGIRRKCALMKDPDGGVWLTWEMRFEEEREDVVACEKSHLSYEHYGYLIGRKMDRNGVWQEPAVLHQGGTCYSISGINEAGKAGIVYLKQSDVFVLPELVLEWIPCSGGMDEKALAEPAAGCPLAGEAEGKVKTGADVKAFLNTHVNAVVKAGSGFERWDCPQPRIVKPDRYVTQVGGQDLGLFWSDTHVHSALSPDAEGEPDELLLYGRDIAGLDAMAMVDNDYYPHAGLMPLEWENQQALAKAFTKPGRFVVFPGYEFTYHDREMKPNFNHRYVIYPRKGPYLPRLDPRSRSLSSLAHELSGSGAILVAHHPSWKLDSSPIDRFVEICSSWRISMEEKDFIKDRLMEGQQFAFIGSSDTHRACPGLGGALTGIYAEELEPDKLFDAYRRRRTIVTQGLRIAIDFRVDDLFIGDCARIGRHPRLRLNVQSPVAIEFVEIYRDDVVIKRYEACGMACVDAFDDDLSQEGDASPQTRMKRQHFYYVRVKTVGEASFNEPDSNRKEYSGPFIRQGRYPFNFARAQGPFAWSTPIWVEVE